MLCILFLRTWECFFSLASGFFSPRGEKTGVIKGRDLFSKHRCSPFYREVIFLRVYLSGVVQNFEFFTLRENGKN